MKILIFRALKIGDMLCALPAIKNLHEFFTQSSISIVALPYMVPFLERYSTYFDSIIPFSGYPGLPEIPFDKIQYQKMVERIRKEKFDLLIQMHGDGSRIEGMRSEEHTSELQSRENLVCRLLLEKKKSDAC